MNCRQDPLQARRSEKVRSRCADFRQFPSFHTAWVVCGHSAWRQTPGSRAVRQSPLKASSGVSAVVEMTMATRGCLLTANPPPDRHWMLRPTRDRVPPQASHPFCAGSPPHAEGIGGGHAPALTVSQGCSVNNGPWVSGKFDVFST